MYQILHIKTRENRNSDLRLRDSLVTSHRMGWYSCESREALVLPRSLAPDSAETENIALIAHEKWTWQCREKQLQNSPSSHCCCGHTYSPLEFMRCFPLPPSFQFPSKARSKMREKKNSILPALHEKS